MKLVVRLLIGLVVLLLLVGLGAGLFLDSLAKQAIERGGSHALGVETRLDGADLGLTSGRFSLSGLNVANPPGFARPAFLELRSSELELPLSILLEDRITIPALVLEGVTLDLERNSTGTNYGVILDNLKRFESEPEDSPEDPTHGGKTFLLQRLVIRDVRASVDLVPVGGDLTKLSLSIPEIVVEDLDSEMSMSELCALVVKTIVNAAIQSGLLPEDLLADLRGRMDGLEEMARVQVEQKLDELESELQGQAQKLGPEAEKALEKAGEKLGGKLDDLLKKKKD
jgi:hypothetical protein